MVKHTVEELNLMDDFLFQEVLGDEREGAEAAGLLLSTIMDREIRGVSVKTQKVVTAGNPELHAIRMDVYLEDEDRMVYDIEVQQENTRELPQRTRYYQALADSRMLKKGMPYKKMQPVFIVLITPVDIFGQDRMCYTFENRCVEQPELSLNDGARRIFLYSKGKKGGNQKLAKLLHYIENSRTENAVDCVTQRLHQIVTRIRKNEEIGVRYMKAVEYEEMIQSRAEREGLEKGMQEGLEKGLEKGKREGEERFSRLLQMLLAAGRKEDLNKALTDSDYREQLYRENKL